LAVWYPGIWLAGFRVPGFVVSATWLARMCSTPAAMPFFQPSVSVNAMRPRVTSVGLIGVPPPVDFVYPVHIDRTSIDALPAKPGVYRFLDEHGGALYIGKSVHLRARVLAHLRTPEEAGMLNRTRRIDHVCTAGEIGALLLESQLIKQEQPPYNCLLKETGEVFVLRLQPGQDHPQVIGSSEVDGFDDGSFFGLFVSRNAAWEGLRAMLRRHCLCPALAGLEKPIRARACFSFQTGCCAGACIGKESVEHHRLRLVDALRALQSSIWPYAGPIGILEETDGWRQIHVVDQWRYLGSLEGRRRKLKRHSKARFDIDVYKILVRPLLLGQLTIVPVSTG
jgi:excinuclease Cho